jgi:hypothetical protein
MNTRCIALFGLLLLLYLIQKESNIYAQEPSSEKSIHHMQAPALKLAGSVYFGLGIDDLTVGETTEGDDITISGGGGLGGHIAAIYAITTAIESSIGIGYEFSSLTPNVKNADGIFPRVLIDATVKYRFAVGSGGLLKIGGGPGYYIPGDLDIDMSKVSGGGHNIYGYKNTAGFHITGEYEGYIDHRFSWLAGLKYYSVSYELESSRLDGIRVPVDLLPQELKNEVGSLDGSGVDIIVSFIWNL